MKTSMLKLTMPLVAAFCMATTPLQVFAESVTADDVTAVVAGWKNAKEALGEQLTADPVSVQEYSGLGGTGTYYVVSLEGGGYVVTSGDTALEPVLAYSKEGEWVDDSARNPLKVMVEIDVAAAMMAEHNSAIKSGGDSTGGRRLSATASVQQQDGAANDGSTAQMAELGLANAAKWAKYKAAASAKGGRRLQASQPSSANLRVSALVQSNWNQDGHGENYYTPPYGPGSSYNYVCGCVATMMSQIMRYWQWPQGTNITAIADYSGYVKYQNNTTNFKWTVNGGYYKATRRYSSSSKNDTVATSLTAWSPAFGGTYDWANMPLNNQVSSLSTTQKQAIGKLTRDCGIACRMTYGDGGSGAAMLCSQRFVDQFAYANAKAATGGWTDANRDALLSNLDAGLPCGVEVPAHAIVADGYGYDNSGTLFVHFNMGWGSVGSDTWYTPPSSIGSFTAVNTILYNIYPPSVGAPELTIVSGRVLRNSTAQSGVTVTATNRETGFTTNVTSNAKGMYYLLLPQGHYTFSATSSGYSAKVERKVDVCISSIIYSSSIDGYGIFGQSAPANIHGLDLNLGTAVAAPAVSLAHRWSFTGDYSDLVGSSTGTAIGSAIAVSDGKLKLTGNGHNAGSLNLGTNLLNTDGATIEIWASQTEVRNWARVFDYGADDTHYFTLAWSNGTDLWKDRAASKNTDEVYVDRSMSPYTLGVQYHISATFERQSDGTTLVRWMRRDAASGALQRSGSTSITNGIHTISNPKLLLGNSQYTGDSDACAEYDEVRVWNGVLTDAQLKASVVAGPDADLSTLPWSGAARRYVAKAVWQGGSAVPTASSLADSANWSCTDQNGDAITGVPEARTLVIIPNGTTGFTIPAGYTPAWRKVRIGSEGAANTQFAKKSAVTGYAAQLEATHAAYSERRDGSPEELARDIALSIANYPASLASSQVLYDGWVNVSAAQAGRWTFYAYADDYASVSIDGEWIAYSGSMSDALHVSSADVSAGWHRFRIVVGDTGGGYGGYVLTGSFRYLTPIAVSVNGGPLLTLSASNFTFGAPSGAASVVTLAGDCDLSAVGEVALDSGAVLDLNGHTFKVNSISSSYLGTTVTNTSATEATLEYRLSPAESGAAGNVEIASNVTAQRLVHTYTWVGGSSGNLSVASNWSPAHAGAFTSDDELVIDSSANITVDVPATVCRIALNAAGGTRFVASGANALTVTEIANTGAGTATFDCPVQFTGMYHVEQTGAVKFPGGATATYPDPSLRTASSSDLARTLDGIFTFTADWNVPLLGDGNHPWRIPAGAEVYGQGFTGSESGNNRILYIANGGYARFTTVAIGNNCGDIGIDGFLEATTEVTVGSKGGSGYLGSGGTTGTIKSPCIRKVGGLYVYVYIPNMIVGAGGFGAGWKDYDLRFYNDVNITASANFDFLGVYNSGNPKDWNLNLNGHTLTINVPEGLTVTFGVTATASGVVRKKGAGTLVMTDTDKNGQSGYVKDYTGGTFIEEGTVRVAASNQIGTGDVTILPSGRLELAAGVTVTNVVKTGSPGAGSLYMENGSSVALSAATPCNLASFELASGASATITTSSSADAGAVLLSGCAGDYASRLAVPSGFTYAGGCVLVPAGAAEATDYVWAGASGGSWSSASNWRVNGATPAAAPTSADTIRFENSSAVAVGGSGTLTVAKIVTTTGAAVTFNCPVAFADTYLVENTVVPPVFAAGATATCPDASLTGMNAASHVLPDGLTLTADWTIPLQPAGNPFVIPAGASITGKVLSAETYNASQPELRIDEGAVATFESVSVNRRLIVWLNGGRLVATGDVLFNGTGGGGDFGYYAQPNVGTVEAHGVYKSTTSGGAITCYVTNFVVGAGGFGMAHKDYMWQFQKDTRVTATDDMTIFQPSDGTSDSDWGFHLNGHVFTVDTAGHTVTFDSYIRESASKIVKEGAGEMIMRSRQKKHSGGTDVKGGKLTVAMNNGAGYGTTTVYSGATLAFTSAATSQGYPIVVKSGATLEWAAAVNDTSSLALEGGAILKPAQNGAFTVGSLSLAGGSGAVVIDMTGLSIPPGVVVPVIGGVASGEEAFFTTALPAGVEGALSVNSSGVLCFVSRNAALIHRWSFDENYNDSAGSANATVCANGGVSLSGGKAILAGGDNAGYLNLGAGVLGSGHGATLELWATNITVASNWAYLFTYGLHDSSPNSFITLCNRSNGLSYSRKTRNGMLEGYVGGTQFVKKNEILIGMPEGMAYHYSVTFRVNGANTVTRWMVRDAATGFLLAEESVTIPGLTLAQAASAGWALTLGHNPFASNLDLNCAFDEVRVWDGVLSDEQLMANAVAGADTPLAADLERVAFCGTFTVPTAGGYGYRTDSAVVLGAGAKIRFDTTGYFGKGLRFKTGGISVPSGSILDYVELSDSANYAATMEDANTILVQLKSTIPYESTWVGGTPSSAADLASAANWTSVNAAGTAISAAPTAKTTVILPAAALATFTVPEGAAPDWGRVLLGGRPATQAGRIAGSPDMNKTAYIYRGIADYTQLGANGIENLNGNGSSATFLKNNIVQSQVRFDGWVDIPADKAGRWAIDCKFDDAVTLFIDGERVFHDPCWNPAVKGGCFVSEGWHRFTVIAADGGGGYGCNNTVSGTKVPFSISVNGGSAVAFHSFTQGSDASTVTLSGDADWRALGELELSGGVTIDLNGHNLAVTDITRSGLGAAVVNGSETASSLYVDTTPASSKAQASGMVSGATIVQIGSKSAIWTGSANDGNALTSGNWTLRNGAGMLIAGIPDAETIVTVSGDNVNLQIPSGSEFRCASLTMLDCTLTADCDWRGLAVTPTITGTADLNGHNLRLNHLVANAGSALANGGDGVSGVVFDAAAGSYAESSYIDGIANLGTSENARIVILRDANDSVSSLTVGNTANKWTELRLTSGSISGSGTAQLLNTANAHGILTIDGADVTVNAMNAPNGNIAGSVDLNVNSGSFTVTTWTDFGNSASAVVKVNQTGGTVEVGKVRSGTNSGNGNFWFGRANSGTATYNLSNGTFTSYGSLRLGSTSNTTGIFNQSGGTVNVTGNQDFSFGYDSGSSGKYYQTGGTLNTQRNIDLRRSGAVLDIGGAVTATAAGIGVNIGTTSGSSGEVILREGGILTTSYIKKGSGTASVTLYGGTLRANTANANFLENLGTVAIGASGVTYDTDYAIGVTGTTFCAPVGITAFTLTGTGSLDLSGVTIDLAAMPTAPYTIAMAAGSGSFIGCPALTVNGEPLSGGWKVVKSADGKKITIKRRKGVMIIAY